MELTQLVLRTAVLLLWSCSVDEGCSQLQDVIAGLTGRAGRLVVWTAGWAGR